eukprot:2105870-Lingulodinium_polyedra.AAC.1
MEGPLLFTHRNAHAPLATNNALLILLLFGTPGSNGHAHTHSTCRNLPLPTLPLHVALNNAGWRLAAQTSVTIMGA